MLILVVSVSLGLRYIKKPEKVTREFPTDWLINQMPKKGITQQHVRHFTLLTIIKKLSEKGTYVI